MGNPLSIGLANMRAEAGEKRAFLPSFVARLEKLRYQIVLEEDYGRKMGFTADDYRQAAPSIRFGDERAVFSQPIVLVLRYPGDDLVRLMSPGSCLISMLHFPTRPARVAFLRSLGVEAVSLDSIRDDSGRRLVENLRAVAWNGVEAAIEVLKQTYPHPGLENPNRPPLYVTLLGSGGVGMHVMQAAIRYGNEAYWKHLAAKGVPGVQITVVDYDLTNHPSIMQDLLRKTDLLIDATQRPDPSLPVIPNDMIGVMANHAVLLDLSVDPYDLNAIPPQIKGIEGIPQGNLDQYIFSPTDPVYQHIPASIKTTHRRYVVSCYSWPGIHPHECMELYGKQIAPLMRKIAECGGIGGIDSHGSFFERALTRGMLSQWHEG